MKEIIRGVLQKDYGCSLLIKRYLRVLDIGFTDGICELHHVLPKSLYPEFDKEEFIVPLTPKAHYIAHLILWRLTRTKEMTYAFMTMRNASGVMNSSRLYEIHKLQFRKEHSQHLSSGVMKDVAQRPESIIRHKILSEKFKEKWKDPEYRRHISIMMKEKWEDPEYRKNISESISKRMKLNNPMKSEAQRSRMKGNENVSKRLEVREKLSIKSSERFHKPWDHPRWNPCNVFIWEKADEIFELWASGLRGKKLFDRVWPGQNVGHNKAQSLMKRIESGWVPNEEQWWKDWKEELDNATKN